jgi:hypothetical protein
MEVWFGRYRVDLLLRGLPRRLKQQYERSGGKLRLFGRRIGPIPREYVLAIEIDGSHHEGNRDTRRDEYLMMHHKVYVVRFDTSEIDALH